ncbi:SIS domain-containing protein [Clostridiaceae bacterium DONG20-135]|uniref:SIS domain-containing protein n=1 Tax=Copranaerobaculum intestinale TaxID=2692629 RepID=A0A6N8U6J9_9FIRM|nr:SIS domain-containing protein [Copranaerobaculum intestinale]MXQ72333.1 SIS domain-containing protein [Copranaerobaculum intestinale]
MEKPTVIGYIMDQPRALKQAYADRQVFIRPFIELFRRYPIKKIYFLGSGTSYHASVIGSYYMKHLLHIDAEAHYPTIFANYERVDPHYDKTEVLFLGISQTGTSISTIQVMQKAKQEGYLTAVLCEDLNSEITHHVDEVIHLRCGKELTPPETRGFTVTVLTLYLWTLELGLAQQKMTNEIYEKYQEELRHLLEELPAVFDDCIKWYQENKNDFLESERLHVLGYGVDSGSALEAALKIGEMFRKPTISYDIEEYAHGPNMALKPDQAIFMIGADEVEWERLLQFRDVFKKYTERIYVITTKHLKDATKRDMIFPLTVNKYLAVILHAIPFQLVAAMGARDSGIDTAVNPFEEPLSHLPDKAS